MSSLTTRARKALTVGRTVAPLWLRGRPILPSRREAGLLVKPWYHDFSSLGLHLPQRPGIFPGNQTAKSPVIRRLLDDALARCHAAGTDAGLLELFCADGYYGVYAARNGAGWVKGADLDTTEVAKANLVARLLGIDNAEFVVADVFEWRERAPAALCAGGLYHLEDPERLLRQLREQVDVALVVQTVYHQGIEDPDYFETPAPGWHWGCRFSYRYLLTMAERSGWEVVHHERNELFGNDRIEDRGSAYLLCVPA